MITSGLNSLVVKRENVPDLGRRLKAVYLWSTLPRPGPPRHPGASPHGPGPRAPASPWVCSASQPQPQGARVRSSPGRRAEPARTLSSPKGRAQGRGAGCSSCRSCVESAVARRPATAEPRARGAQRSRGSIAAAEAADTCGCKDDSSPGAP